MSKKSKESSSPSLLDSLKRFQHAYFTDVKNSKAPANSKIVDNSVKTVESGDDESNHSDSPQLQRNKDKRARPHHALSTSESDDDDDDDDDESSTSSSRKRLLQEDETTENKGKKFKTDTSSSQGESDFNESTAVAKQRVQASLNRYFKNTNEIDAKKSSNMDNDNDVESTEKSRLLKSIRENFNKAIDAGSTDSSNKYAISPKRFYQPTSMEPHRTSAPSNIDSKKPLPPKHVEKESDSKKKKKRINTSDDNDNDRDEDDDATVTGHVYDSDADSDDEVPEVVKGVKARVLNFINTASLEDLSEMRHPIARVEALCALRPFTDWQHLVETCESNKAIGPKILNATQHLLSARGVISSLMRQCEIISNKSKQAVELKETNIKTQPSILNSGMQLKDYQMVGLNWLALMHSQGLNGILADEMGLGKTIQVIAFLAYLKEQGLSKSDRTHLIVVPSSTLENWMNEFEKWCPDINVCQYYGNVDERRHMRVQLIKRGIKDIDVIIGTYAIIAGRSFDDRKLFRMLKLQYIIFDEGHMLKNMYCQRFDSLYRIKAENKLLLTGTPIQNNLLELMSLLVFVMPTMFSGEKLSSIKFIFEKRGRNVGENLKFYQENIDRAKKVMTPFILRRLKADVLKLPTKTSLIVECPMLESQTKLYRELMDEAKENLQSEGTSLHDMGCMMRLRRLANHPLAVRHIITDTQVEEIAKLLVKKSNFKDKNLEKVTDDLYWMSDHKLHQLVEEYKCPKKYLLPEHLFLESGKLAKLDELLADLKANGHRVLIFSQFCFMLDLYEVYLRQRQHSYLRIDGSTAVLERQELIDEFNRDDSIFVFLLTTKAGGMGINLTAADTVIINDVDFNPYNDKQAEDRAHRMGQTREVKVIRLISKGTIEEIIHQYAQEKTRLGKNLTKDEENEDEERNMLNILRRAIEM